MRNAAMTQRHLRASRRQCGASAVEFAFLAVILFTLLFGIVEFSRLFFNINSVQEVTRRAAREQAVRWVADGDIVRRSAMLQPDGSGVAIYPGAIDITSDRVQLGFYNTFSDAASETNPITYSGSATAQANLGNCLTGSSNCIRFVRASLNEADGTLVNFNVLTPFMPSTVFPLPDSTVIMPAEALGLL
jgi:Flp pilus assembly protein TadG